MTPQCREAIALGEAVIRKYQEALALLALICIAAMGLMYYEMVQAERIAREALAVRRTECAGANMTTNSTEPKEQQR